MRYYAILIMYVLVTFMLPSLVWKYVLQLFVFAFAATTVRPNSMFPFCNIKRQKLLHELENVTEMHACSGDLHLM